MRYSLNQVFAPGLLRPRPLDAEGSSAMSSAALSASVGDTIMVIQLIIDHMEEVRLQK